MYSTPPRQSSKALPASCPVAGSDFTRKPRDSSLPKTQPAPTQRVIASSPPPTPTRASSNPNARTRTGSLRPVLPPRVHSGSVVAQIALQNLSLHAWEVNPFEASFLASSPPRPEESSPRQRWASLVGLDGDEAEPAPPPVAVNLFGYEAVVGADELGWAPDGDSKRSVEAPGLVSKWSVSSCGSARDVDSDGDDEDELDSIRSYYLRTDSLTDSDNSSSRASSFSRRTASLPFGFEPPSAAEFLNENWNREGPNDPLASLSNQLREFENYSSTVKKRPSGDALGLDLDLDARASRLKKRSRCDTLNVEYQAAGRPMDWNRSPELAC